MGLWHLFSFLTSIHVLGDFKCIYMTGSRSETTPKHPLKTTWNTHSNFIESPRGVRFSPYRMGFGIFPVDWPWHQFPRFLPLIPEFCRTLDSYPQSPSIPGFPPMLGGAQAPVAVPRPTRIGPTIRRKSAGTQLSERPRSSGGHFPRWGKWNSI